MRNRLTAAMAAFAMLAVACGQYPGVHEQAVASGQVSGAFDAAGEPLDGTGIDGSLDGSAAAAADGLTGTAAGEAAGGTDAGGTGAGGGAGGGGAGGPVRGVGANEIRIGIHAPLTGAAPISPASFRDGKDLYWTRGTDNPNDDIRIHGRRVRVFFEDDQYNPTHVRDVCKKMVEQDNVFLLIGGGGTDQIHACASYAAGAGIPYLSSGVTEVGMRNLRNYFALSMSYPQQIPMLVRYIKQKFTSNANNVALVATDTPFFDDAVQEFRKRFSGVTVFRHGKNESGASMAQNICGVRQFDVVVPLVAPLYYLEMAKAAKCNPQYAGVGITMGLDTVALNGCRADRSTQGARFLSPAPAFANSNQYDRDFRKAAGGGADDIMFLLWGLSKGLHQLLENAGQSLTPQGFVAAAERSTVRTGVYPTLRFSPSNHFGANEAHMLRNVCEGSGGHYVTEQAFMKG